MRIGLINLFWALAEIKDDASKELAVLWRFQRKTGGFTHVVAEELSNMIIELLEAKEGHDVIRIIKQMRRDYRDIQQQQSVQ
jgi:hypothetical protein